MSEKKDLSKQAFKLYQETFTESVRHFGDKQKAHKKAWNVIKNKFEKNDKTGMWEKKDHE